MGVIRVLSMPVVLLAFSAGWGLNAAHAAGSPNAAGSPSGEETERYGPLDPPLLFRK